jgi:hypothetical protein
MEYYYGWKLPKTSTIITIGCNKDYKIWISTQANGCQEAS